MTPLMLNNILDSNWTPFYDTWDAFRDEELDNTGTLNQYKYEDDDKIYTALIGDMNEMGGICDCCRDITQDAIITRYVVIFQHGDDNVPR